MGRYKGYIFGLQPVQLADGGEKRVGYLVNIITPKNKRVSGGIWETRKEAIKEARKYIRELAKH